MMHARSHRSIPIALAVAAALGGCSSDDDMPADGGPATDGPSTSTAGAGATSLDDDATETADPLPARPDSGNGATLYGVVGMSLYRRSNDAPVNPQPSAQFFRSDARPFGDLDYVPPADTCRGLGQSEDVGSDSSSTASDGTRYQPLSAGETIVFTSPTGTYVTLVRQVTDDDVFYPREPGTSLATPVPSGLVLDIPGDEYPAFPNVALPEVEPLVDVGVSGSVTAGLAFDWAAGRDPAGLIAITVSFDDPEAEGSSFAFVQVRCDAADDGAFELPPSVRDSTPPGWTARATVSRRAELVRREGDAALIVGSSSIVAFRDGISTGE